MIDFDICDFLTRGRHQFPFSDFALGNVYCTRHFAGQILHEAVSEVSLLLRGHETFYSVAFPKTIMVHFAFLACLCRRSFRGMMCLTQCFFLAKAFTFVNLFSDLKSF